MMNRKFTRRGSVVLLFLVALVMVLGYVKLFYQPMQDRVIQAEERRGAAADEMLLEQAKYGQMQEMQAQLEDLEAAGTAQNGTVPDYDNIENVMVQLDAILSAAQDYSLTFADVQPSDDGLMTRPVQMNFTAAGYAQARVILNRLYDCPYRCVLSDLSATAEKDLSAGAVSVDVTATFFEKLT